MIKSYKFVRVKKIVEIFYLYLNTAINKKI